MEQVFDMEAVAVGAIAYYGSQESRRQIQEISEAFPHAHELGMATVLWAYLRNSAFKHEGTDYRTAANITGQANHLAATIKADIIQQKQAVCTAVINKCAGGMGMISGRKASQRPMGEGVGLLNAIQDVYLSEQVTIA